jgi:hypothetical protein
MILIQREGSEDVNRNMGPKMAGLARELYSDHPYDVLLAMPPNHYMEYDETEGVYLSLEKRSPGPSVLTEANTIMGHDALFDAENQRIGWAGSRCDYSYLVDNLESEEKAGVFLAVSLGVAAALLMKGRKLSNH